MTWRGAGLLAVCTAIVAIGAAVPAFLIVGLVLVGLGIVAVVTELTACAGPGGVACRPRLQ